MDGDRARGRGRAAGGGAAGATPCRDQRVEAVGRHGHDFDAAGDRPVGDDDGVGTERLLDLAQAVARSRGDETFDVHVFGSDDRS